MNTQQVAPRIVSGAISSVFANAPVEDLSEGIRSALATVSILGGVFGVRYRKTRYELNVREIEVVILKGARTTSKAFFPGGYDGSDRSPECWSSNGKVPDQQVLNPVRPSCSICPNDVFTTNAQGLKGKPCSDGKRIAVVPASDMANDGFGGPMLFRVPAGSLGALEMFGKDLKKLGVPFYAMTAIIKFVPGVVTKLEFEPGRPLTDEEAIIIIQHRDDERTARIVNEEIAVEEEVEAPAPTAAAPPVAAAPAQTTPRVTPPPAAVAQHQQNRPTAAVGGFAVTSKPTIVQPVQTTPAPIAAALANPAAPPPSVRVIQQPMEQQEAAESANQQVDDLFDTLMAKG